MLDPDALQDFTDKPGALGARPVGEAEAHILFDREPWQ
jgi:hypothetical protein